MPIFRNSRYAKTPVHKRDGVLCFKTRKRFKFPTENATVHLFQEGERLDGLALRYYGDSQLRWVILDANPRFARESDIPYGTELVIPDYREVRRVYGN